MVESSAMNLRFVSLLSVMPEPYAIPRGIDGDFSESAILKKL